MVFLAKVKGGSRLGVVNLGNICLTKDLTASLFFICFEWNQEKSDLACYNHIQSNQRVFSPTAMTWPANADFNNLLIIGVRVPLGNFGTIRTSKTERRGKELQQDKGLSLLKY